MTIKEAEKMTGLTAKSIRYYETKGLLRVERDRHNDYRRYTEEDIDRLRSIKVLRYLGFPVDEIPALLDGDGEARAAALQERGRALGRGAEESRMKQDLCDSLAREVSRGRKPFADCIRDYDESIEYLESEEGETLLGDLREWFVFSLPEAILTTLILSGPILWLFLRIHERQWDLLVPTALAAVVSSALMALQWVWYFRNRARHRDSVRKKNRKNVLVLPLMLVLIAGGIALAVGLDAAVGWLLAPPDYLFYEFTPAAEKGIPLLVMVFAIIVMAFGLRLLGVGGAEALAAYADYFRGRPWLRWAAAAVLAAGLYLCFTSVTVVTPSAIVRHDPLHPAGVSYAYEQVEEIDAGFRRSGDFRYRLRLDGRWVTFSVPSSNGKVERYADTYLELEELDRALTALDIPKTASEDHWESCRLAERYVDRFLRIIRNVPAA